MSTNGINSKYIKKLKNNRTNYNKEYKINSLSDKSESYDQMIEKINKLVQDPFEIYEKDNIYNTKDRNIQNQLFIQYQNFNQQSECIICLELFKYEENIATTPCFHIFHNKCLVEWLKIKNFCPLCRINF